MKETAISLRKQRAYMAADRLDEQRKRLEDQYWNDLFGGPHGLYRELDREEEELRDQQAIEMSRFVRETKQGNKTGKQQCGRAGVEEL